MRFVPRDPGPSAENNSGDGNRGFLREVVLMFLAQNVAISVLLGAIVLLGATAAVVVRWFSR